MKIETDIINIVPSWDIEECELVSMRGPESFYQRGSKFYIFLVDEGRQD